MERSAIRGSQLTRPFAQPANLDRRPNQHPASPFGQSDEKKNRANHRRVRQERVSPDCSECNLHGPENLVRRALYAPKTAAATRCIHLLRFFEWRRPPPIAL